MAIRILNTKVQIKQSLFIYLQNKSYERDNVTKTLEQFFGVNIKLDYPDDITNLILPTIALGISSRSADDVLVFGNRRDQENFLGTIYGFSGGLQSDGHNKAQRDELGNDLVGLFNNQYIDLYNTARDTVIANIETINAKAREVSPSSSLDAERYRFIVEFNIILLKDRLAS